MSTTLIELDPLALDYIRAVQQARLLAEVKSRDDDTWRRHNFAISEATSAASRLGIPEAEQIANIGAARGSPIVIAVPNGH